jgi:DNA-binding CsgD family transcriptional regulator
MAPISGSADRPEVCRHRACACTLTSRLELKHPAESEDSCISFLHRRLTADRALCLAQLGRIDEARTLIRPLLDDVEGNIDDELLIAHPLLLLQAAVVFKHQAAAKALVARLACVAHVAIDRFYTGVARHLGDAAREREIARLMTDGRSNREIAERLIITEGTVEVHVKHILSKLGLKSRAQVAVWAADERL